MDDTTAAHDALPTRRVGRSARRIFVFSAAIHIAALLLAVTLARSAAPAHGFFSTWWGVVALGALFAASELLVVHFQVGRSAHTVSVVEAIFVIALFHGSSVIALAAQMLGCGVVLAVHRRQGSAKLFFNLGMFALENQLAFAAFRAIEAQSNGNGTPGLRSWFAAYTATGVFTLTGTVLVFGVIYLAEHELAWPDIVHTVRIALITSAIMASIGILASTLLAVSPASAVLLIIPIAGAYATNRTFLRERRRIEELEFLRESSAKLLGDDVAEQTLWGVLEAARAEFRVELVEYEQQDADGQSWKRFSFRRGQAPVVARVASPTLAAVCPPCATLVDTASDTPNQLTADIAQRGIGRVAIVAPVGVRGVVAGVLIIARPSTDVASFGQDDLRLADMLASQLSSAMENGRLEQSVAELRGLESRLVFELQHDGLTGLLNRAAFVRRVRESIARVAGDRTNAVVFVDLDDFKPINDTYGHAAGDILLKVIGERLQASIRTHDLAARLGGDEFAVFLNPVANREEAADAANRLLNSLQQPIMIREGEFVTPGASIGVAIASLDDTLESILERADAAMFHAKNRGKGHVEVLDPTMNETIRLAYELELELNHAVAHKELDLAFQSVHRLNDGAVAAYECLMRWNHPEHGVLFPEQFMASGLRGGVQRGIRRFVSEEAGRALERLTAAGYRGPLSVNLGAGQALDDTLVGDLITLFGDTGVEPHRFLVEIAESTFQRSAETKLRRADELRAAGARIVLDDLTLDKLTLGLLERLQPTQVKLSRALVAELHVRPGAKPFVRAVTEFGVTAGYSVVAKGLEDQQTASLALRLGCAYGQGFVFSRPASLEQILPLVGAHPGDGNTGRQPTGEAGGVR